jgi:hypothetical protein
LSGLNLNLRGANPCLSGLNLNLRGANGCLSGLNLNLRDANGCLSDSNAVFFVPTAIFFIQIRKLVAQIRHSLEEISIDRIKTGVLAVYFSFPVSQTPINRRKKENGKNSLDAYEPRGKVVDVYEREGEGRRLYRAACDNAGGAHADIADLRFVHRGGRIHRKPEGVG